MFKDILILTIIFLMGLTQICAQDKVQAELLKQDLIILRDIVLGTSPSLTHNDSTQIYEMIELETNALGDDPKTIFEFVDLLSEIDMPAQFDEHASMELDEEVLFPILSKAQLFPIPIKIYNNQILVNCLNTDIPFGSVIQSLNDQPIGLVLASLSKDLSTHSKRRLEKQFAISYSIQHPSYRSYKVTYSTPEDSNSQQEISLTGIPIDEWLQAMNEASVFPLKRDHLQNLINTEYYPQYKTFYFQLNGFSMKEEDKKGLFERLRGEEKQYDNLFKKTFKEIKKSGAENLIIDLRYNSGGSIYIPGLLYSYIAEENFIVASRVKIPDFDFPHVEYLIQLGGKAIEETKGLDVFINNYRSNFLESDSGFYWEVIERQLIQANKNAFEGKVFLLVGGNTISAASYFSALFRGHERGLIVGEEIGGSHHTMTAGTSITYQLPHSGLKVKVPLMEVHFAKELYTHVPEIRIIPDLVLSWNDYYKYFLEQKDPEIEMVFREISKNN